MVLLRIAALVLATGLVLSGGAAEAASSPWTVDGAARARLLAVVNATGDRKVIPAGVDIGMDEGWDTYWRSPGAAGAPPKVDWSTSRNVADVAWRWPAPHRFTLFGMETFGYSGEVVFPVDITVKRPGEPVSLRAKADVLVCSNICVPHSVSLALDLPAGPAAVDPGASNLIARFQARVPDDGTSSGLSVLGATVERGRHPALVVRIASVTPVRTPDVIVEAGRWTFGKPVVTPGDGGRTATVRLPVTAGPDAVTMPGAPATVTVTDGSRAAEASLTIDARAVEPVSPLREILPVVGIALLGGLILNVMPCVLPVLSLKLMSVVKHSGEARRRVCLGFLATASGIVASMLVIAVALVGLKAAGATVGWGMQFQQPVFLVFMTAVLVLFAANLAGAFEVRLPSAVADLLGRTGGDSLGGNVATGAFATLLATPCSAPFLGTAIGFALARGPLDILAIFTVLGVGLALPFLLVAAFPGMTALLPRPGRWMKTLRFVLAAALGGTAVWLLSVLAVQVSWSLALGVGLAVLLVPAALVAAGRANGPRRAAAVGVGILALVSGLTALLMAERATGGVDSLSATVWTPFDEAAIPGLVARGRTVLVDVTADWCITCIANKTLVLDRGKVASVLASETVLPMKADWTQPNRRIAEFLARHDRYGIPFNAVYGPGAPSGIVLPEVLAEDAVLDAIRRAALAAGTGDRACARESGRP